jgi:hypothetical protein
MRGNNIRRFSITALALLSVGASTVRGSSEVDFWPGLEPGPYAVGFEAHHVYDHGRSFTVFADGDYISDEAAGSRPLQILVWYPAEKRAEPAYMEIWEYVRLRHTRYGFADVGKVSRQEVFDRLLQGPGDQDFDSEAVDRLLTSKTLAIREAEPAGGRFPLLIYGPGAQSEGWDNFVLFEYLASHGYVVAATSSTGYGSNRMTLGFEDLEAMTRDHEFVLAFLWDRPVVDRSRVGGLGWSFGGLSVTKFAMRHRNVGAVTALDGSMGYVGYRRAAEESPDYDYDRLRVPFMYMSQKMTESKDLSFLDDLDHVDRYLLTFPRLQHFDFSSVAIFREVHARGERSGKDRRVVEEGYAAVGRYVRAFFDSALKRDEKGNEFLVRAPEESGIGPDVVIAEAMPATVSRLTKPQFMEMIRAGEIDRAIDAHDRIHETDPDVELFDELELGMEALRLIQIDRAGGAIKILELIGRTTGKPNWQLHEAKAMAYLAEGRTEDALASYANSLELRPEGRNAQAALDSGADLKRFSSAEWLGRFVGEYSGGDWTSFVTLGEDGLIFRVPGQEPARLLPISRTLFLFAGMFCCTVEFGESAAGHVETVVLHIPSGDKKMKRKGTGS